MASELVVILKGFCSGYGQLMDATAHELTKEGRYQVMADKKDIRLDPIYRDEVDLPMLIRALLGLASAEQPERKPPPEILDEGAA